MLVTNLVLPEDRVIFGVLTLIGSCMLMFTFLKDAVGRIINSTRAASAAVLVSAVLFILFRDVNSGVIGNGMLCRILPQIPFWGVSVPPYLYKDLLTAYLGFPPAGFYSTDYFSLLPWCFLYFCGYALHILCRECGAFQSRIFKADCRPLSFLGRNSLMIYLLHQPVLYLFVLLYGALQQI